MTRTRKLLAWVLLICMILGMVPSMALTAGAEGTEAVVINAMDYGADPTGAADSTEAIWAALQAAKELEADGHPVVLEFPRGEYHIYKDRAQTREYHTSNTNSIENPIKTIGILIEEHENLTLDGNGSLFMMHGNMMALAVVKSENITLKDFAWDFAVPTVTEMTVTASGSNYTEYYIPECFPYTISGNTLVWSSDLSPYTGQPYWTATGNHNTYALVVYHADDQMSRNFGTDISPFTNATGITQVGNNVIRITYSYKNGTQQAHHKPGTVIALCGNAHRETAGAFTWESKNVLAEGVNVHFMHGFGWLIQMSEDVTYRNCNLMPRENSGHMTVSFADGLHASGAAGEIVIENCNFSNTHDDPINFHGTFTRVEQRIDDYTLKLKYIHNQQGGFPQFHEGDQVAFFTRDTLESSDNETLYTVAEVVSDPGEDGNDLRTMVVRFEEVLPAFLSDTVSNGSPKYVAENVTYAPAVTIKGCTFKNVATRGILCTTRKPVLIEGNTFLNMSMATIFLSNDSNDWYESGPIRDMTIRNNFFYIKTIGDTYWDYKSAIYIHPVTYGGSLPSADNPIHKNITIEGNTFHMSDDTVVKAESVENLIIRNNTILRADPEFEITLSGEGGELSLGQTRQLSVAATGTTIIGDNNKNLSDTTSRNYDNVFEFTACKNVVIEGNTYDDGMKNYAVISNMPQSGVTNKDQEISLVTDSSMPARDPVSDLVYVSTDPDVVSVDAEGQVTAVGSGTAEVYCYYVWNGTVVRSNALTFSVGSGTGSQTGDAVVTLGDTLVLTADNTTAQLTAPGKDTAWTVTDFLTGAAATAATVAADGTVTAVSGGIVWVTATSGSTVVKTPVVISMSRVSQLNSGFEIKKPDPANYELREDGVVITQKGGNDLWTYDNTLENLFLYDAFDTTDLRTVVKIDGLPVKASNNWDTASFLLFAGYDDYVSIGKKGHMNGFATVVEQAQVCSEYDENSTVNNDVTTAYVGFTVQNGTISMDYSLDGTTWTTAKTADAAILGSSYKIGLAAWGVGQNDVTFSQLRVGKASEVSYEQLMRQSAIPVLRTGNQAPTADGVTFGAASYQVGEKATVTFRFTDADGDTQGDCLYLWSYTQDGSVHTAVTDVPEFTVSAPGGLTCGVYPVDSLGMPGAPAEATVTTASGEVNLALSSLAVNGTAMDVDAASCELVIPADLNKVEIRYQSLMDAEGTTVVTVGSTTVTRGNNDCVSLDITGADIITITRSAEGKDDKVYTVRLIRAESNATDIRGIQIPELSFSAADLSAGTWLTRTTESAATLKVLSDDSIGTVKVAYNNYREPITMTRTADGYEGRLEFVTGLNSYYVTVVAKDGVTLEQYNVNVVRTPDTTSELRDVKINGVSLEGFSPDQYEYVLDCSGMETLTVEAVTDQRVRIRIGDAYILEDSGRKSLTAEDLQGGGNVYIVTVADDGIVRQAYTLKLVAFERKNVALKPGETATFNDETGYYVGADTSGLDTSVATVNITGTVTATEKALSQPVAALVSGSRYLIVNTRANKPVTNAPASAAAQAGAGSGLSLNGGIDTIEDAAIWTITAVNGKYTVRDLSGKYMTIGSNSAGISDAEALLNLNYNGSTWTIDQDGAYLNHFGGGSSTCAAGWKDGSAAGDDGSQWAIYEVREIVTEGATQITFTGVKAGETSLRIGETVYNITVGDSGDDQNHKDILLGVGQSKVVIDKTGDFSGDVDVSGLDQSIATAAVRATVTADTRHLSERVTSLVSGRQYLIFNTRAMKPVTNANATAAAEAGAGSGLLLSGSKDAIVDAAVWTLTETENGGYALRDANGKYMTIGSNSAGLSDTAAELAIAYNGSTWTIAQGGAYLNHFGGSSSTCAAGWQSTAAAGDPGSQWEFYEVITTPGTPATEITITGVSVGETSVRVGNTVYRITVSSQNVSVVTLDPNYSGAETDSVSVFTGSAVGELPVPMRPGHTFFGWYLNGTQVTSDYVVNEDITLVADWVSVTTKERPANGTTTGQPFPVYDANGNAYCYRIPGIVTLDNGTVIAMSDHRWNTWADCGGLDTIVSVSTDNGRNWTYTFANYLGDNGDTYNPWSTTFIDPAIATDGTTAYMIADLFPAGVSTMAHGYASQAGNSGFDARGHLILRDLIGDTCKVGAARDQYIPMATSRSYDFYLNPEADGTYTIRKAADDSLVEGYTVDAFLNIRSTDGSVDTHLFKADSPYQVYPTNYLYMNTSSDGLTWSAPRLLNLKQASESAFLVGPGTGTYDPNTGCMVFTAYCYSGSAGSQRSCLIWMDRDGNWTRSAPATDSQWSSEASAVVLGDGTVRVFFRDDNTLLSYTDYKWVNGAYERDENNVRVTTDAAKNGGNGCMLSAYRYSKPINGKEAIVVATPATSNSRSDGHIYVFLVNADGTMDLAYDHDITEGTEYYAYSCLTELKSGEEAGSLALFWEDSWNNSPAAATIRYSVIPMETVTARENDVFHSYVDVALQVGQSAAYTDHTGDYSGTDTSALDTSVATVQITGHTEQVDAAAVLSTGTKIPLSDCLYTFDQQDDGTWLISAKAGARTVYIDPYVVGNGGYPNREYKTAVTLLDSAETGDQAVNFETRDSGSSSGVGYLHFWDNDDSKMYWDNCSADSNHTGHDLLLYRAAEAGETSSTEIPGYVRVNGVAGVADGGKYLIVGHTQSGKYCIMTPAFGGAKQDHVSQVSGQMEVRSTEITFTGVGVGETSLLVGRTVYQITVTATPHEHVYDRKVATEEYLATPADCENAATYYYSCSCGLKGTETFEDGEALGHAWTVTYDFAADGSACTAKRTCGNDAEHVETATATVTSEVTKAPTCEAKGETTYTATFTKDWAETQTKTLEDVAALDHAYGDPVIVWNEDNTASASVTCANDKTHVIELEVKVTSETTEGDCKTKSATTYTAAVTYGDKTYTDTRTVEGELGEHTGDTNNDHKCDLCGAELSKCEDTDPEDHKCDICGKVVSECADKDNDHKCDVCDKVLSECVDENEDYKCDICGAELEKPEQPEKDEVIRLAGANRWETALKVADEMKANMGLEKFDAIIIASGNDFADALAGSYLSTVKNAPILLGWGKGGKFEYLDTDNIEYIKANLAEGGTVYILGGKNAVPELYENELKGYNVKRLGGANRFETNLLILAEAGVKDGSEILVCTSTNFADSLSASATAKPILLVFNEYGKLYGKQPEFLSNLKNCTFTVIGGESAVSAKLADAIKAYGAVTRLAGANRFETSVMVAQKYFKDVDTAVLAYAWNYPDGLCGGSLAYSLKAPLILTMTKYEAKAVEYAKEAGIETGLVLGGETLISDEAVRVIFAMDTADEIIEK